MAIATHLVFGCTASGSRTTHGDHGGGIHPLADFSGPPTPWARGGWFVHLDDENDALAAIEYVSRNPHEAGLPSQKWSFVKSILD